MIPITCGNTTNLSEAMAETGAQGLSLDAMVALAEVARRVPSDCVVIGNIDPVRVPPGLALCQGCPRTSRLALLGADASFR